MSLSDCSCLLITPIIPGILLFGYNVMVCTIPEVFRNPPVLLVYPTTQPSCQPRPMARLPTSELFFARLSVSTYPDGISSGVRARDESGTESTAEFRVTGEDRPGDAEGIVDVQAAPASAAQTSRTEARYKETFIVHGRPGRYKKMIICMRQQNFC